MPFDEQTINQAHNGLTSAGWRLFGNLADMVDGNLQGDLGQAYIDAARAQFDALYDAIGDDAQRLEVFRTYMRGTNETLVRLFDALQQGNLDEAEQYATEMLQRNKISIIGSAYRGSDPDNLGNMSRTAAYRIYAANTQGAETRNGVARV